MIKEEIKNTKKLPHCLTLDNRKILSLSGIVEVGSFDDKTVIAYTDLGALTIKGKNLNIKKLNLEMTELDITGKISSLNYADKSINQNAKLFKKLFKK